MKLIYICSPYRAESSKVLKRNIAYATELTKDILLAGDCPITPHLYMTQCLDEHIERERQAGLAAGLELLILCDVIMVGTKYGISEGMAAEISKAQEWGIRIDYV